MKVLISDRSNHPPKIIEDIKKCLIESQSFGPLNLGEMRNVDTGEMYEFCKMWVSQMKDGVFLIFIKIKKYRVDAAGLKVQDPLSVLPTSFYGGRVVAKVSRIPIPSLKEACQQVIRSLVKNPEKVEQLNLPKAIQKELRTQCQWFNITNGDAVPLGIS